MEATHIDIAAIKVVAFDLFGTVFDMTSVPRWQIDDYIAQVRAPEWSPLKLPDDWEYLRRFPDAWKGLQQLRKSRLAVVTCSNAPRKLTKSLCGVLAFDGYTDIAANRVYKPHPQAYLAICQQFKCMPADVLMVTGNAGSPDIEGARAVGMQSILIRQPGTPPTIEALANLLLKSPVCGQCGAFGVRLYRPYGEFRHPHRDRCNACISEDFRGWMVPLLPTPDGDAWGYTSAPDSACNEFYVLHEKSKDHPYWLRIGGRCGWSNAVDAYGISGIENSNAGEATDGVDQ